jgi:hypothetical protein
METTLRGWLLSLDPFERLPIEGIFVEPRTSGYQARGVLALYRPDVPENYIHPLKGVDCSAAVKADDLLSAITWRISAWEQIVAVVSDQYLSQTNILGTMHGNEHAKVIDGQVCEEDKVSFWHISTHGKSRSTERNAWYASIHHNPIQPLQRPFSVKRSDPRNHRATCPAKST